MRASTLNIAVLTLLFFSACVSNQDYLLTEKDLIPEGTAYNENTNTIYIGSIYKQKIIGIGSDGEIHDQITSDQFGDLSPLGMEMDNGSHSLWVSAAASPVLNHRYAERSQSSVLSFDTRSKQLIKSYELPQGELALLNDITLDTAGNVYATETLGGKIYMVDKVTDQLVLFYALENYSFPNGIVYYQAQNCLLVATNEGVLKIKLSTKEVRLLEPAPGIDTGNIDGLAVYGNYLIGHQGTKVSRFYFDQEVSKIIRAEILDSGKEFDSSTTGEIASDYYYFIVNAQVRSGIDQATKTIKPLDSLEQVIVRKIKLE